MYGRSPPTLLSYVPGTTKVKAVDQELRARDQVIEELQDQLKESQARMKKVYDKHHTERSFKEGDWVYLRLQPYQQMSLSVQRNLKLSPRYYGPYKVLQKVRPVAYKLELPQESLIHPTFHVSFLKKKLGKGVEV